MAAARRYPVIAAAAVRNQADVRVDGVLAFEATEVTFTAQSLAAKKAFAALLGFGAIAFTTTKTKASEAMERLEAAGFVLEVK